ncbi:MAG TPA: spore maturation protein [Tenericutes bacterium]|nr:spore maturation protein [Mycoplasmatota bacterium]
MINKVWTFLIIIGIFFSVITNRIEMLNNIIFDSAKISFDMITRIFPVMALWLGIMKIAQVSGLLNKISFFLEPFFKKLFPEIPKGHESLSYISANFISNAFGLGNASTPFGIKAMKSLNELNKDKKTASRSMITFIILNTSGLTIVPTTLISLRMLHNSKSPASISFICLLVTFLATVFGLTLDRLFSKRYKE